MWRNSGLRAPGFVLSRWQMGQALLLVIPPLVLALLGWRYRWVVDDGYIYLRVVEHITAGYGPVFNIGERVEVFSSVVWQALLTLADVLLPLRLEWLAVWLGIILSIIGLLLAMAGSARLVRISYPETMLWPFGALLPVGVFVCWFYVTSGMETGLVMAWLGGCIFVLGRWAAQPRQRLPVMAAALIGLGGLVRPELALFSVLFAVMVLALQWPRDSWPQRLGLLLAISFIPIAYQIFRMGYYGSLVANPALAKDAASPQWQQGWLYLMDFMSPYWLWPVLILVLAGGYLPLVRGLWHRRAMRALAVLAVCVICAVLHALYIVTAGGDWLHGRLLLPALYVLVLPVAVLPVTRAFMLAMLIVPWVVSSALWFRPPQVEKPTLVDPVIHTGMHVTVEEKNWGPQGGARRQLAGKGFYVDTRFGKDFVRVEGVVPGPYVRLPGMTTQALGHPPYALGPDWYVIDVFGLAHPLVARFESTPSLSVLPRVPGHKKPLPKVWLYAMIMPEGLEVDPQTFPGTYFNPLIPDTPGDQLWHQVALVREVLDCPALVELHAAVTEPLSLQRFIKNFTGAWTRTRLTIPPDPELAWQKFCA